jgi:predicted cupin superfamily sugar epimerase
MHRRARELIDSLDLKPHPEGGFYRETWRSPIRVGVDQRPPRSALTSIYFLLAAGSFSAWHRVRSDEVWHWYEGEPLELLLVSPDLGTRKQCLLGPVAADTAPAVTVPADWWQAARPRGAYVLCGCTVAPGFEFEDFSFLRDQPSARDALQLAAPELLSLL